MPLRARGKYAFDKGFLSLYPVFVYAKFTTGGKMIRLSNLYGLFQLGSDLQEFNYKLDNRHTWADINLPFAQLIRSFAAILSGEIIPLVAINESAKKLIDLCVEFAKNAKANWEEPLNIYYTSQVKEAIIAFQFAISEELRQLPTYIATEKGILSIDKLVDGASKGYSKRTISLLDDFTCFEIDEAGRCLAFGLFTACGFHILRSLEVAIKGYIFAAKGSLPPLNRRNWGEYIAQLMDIGASSELIDCISIIKSKSNPLMHPQDKLDLDEAIDIFNLCNSTMNELIKDVFNKNLELKFKDAVLILPTL